MVFKCSDGFKMNWKLTIAQNLLDTYLYTMKWILTYSIAIKDYKGSWIQPPCSLRVQSSMLILLLEVRCLIQYHLTIFMTSYIHFVLVLPLGRSWCWPAFYRLHCVGWHFCFCNMSYPLPSFGNERTVAEFREMNCSLFFIGGIKLLTKYFSHDIICMMSFRDFCVLGDIIWFEDVLQTLET